MLLNPDHLTPPCLARTGRWATVALALLAAGCASSVGQQRSNEAASSPTPTPLPVLTEVQQPVTIVTPTPPQTENPTLSLLVYAERARRMQPPELSQEVARLGDAASPAKQLQLAMVLSQFRQLPEFQRAQELLSRVLANTSAEAQALHPLAGLLAARWAEQRRLEDLLDKQNQQTRELQRRLDQTTDRLEALKAIERSLTSRPAQTPAPNSRGNHTPTP